MVRDGDVVAGVVRGEAGAVRPFIGESIPISGIQKYP